MGREPVTSSVAGERVSHSAAVNRQFTILGWRGRVLAEEATKAGVASEDTLLIPSPPYFIAKET